MVGEEQSGAAEHALLRPVREGNAFEETVERLLQFVRLGVVGTGDRLPAERELAVRLRVSRVTLREAIRALTDSGYVESRRGRYGGTFVAQSLPAAPGADLEALVQRMGKGLEDTLTMRQVLEAGAAEAAAARTLTREQRRHLSDQLAETSTASLAEYRRRDSRLHLAISEITESPSLIAGVADARSRVNELLDAIPLLPANIEHSNEQHRMIVDRILAGDPHGAREAMAEHLAGTAALLRGFLA
ncbi:FadR/GntR family transcriptional regulator [Pseudonocardia spinosispora]|uniref:FadR/GntR family transcriptional regulator n=1 Tax=Pseudonocardia spinosispora TaxID=103441 RepID=UPI0003FE23BF|nr:FCD domain-containing protein [Pseudonocardia spinosispora]